MLMTVSVIVVAFLVLLFAVEVFRRSDMLTLAVFFVLPVVLLPWLVLSHADFGWFLWLKNYSVEGLICLFVVCRLTPINKTKWLFSLIWLMVMFNIVEAAVYDALSGNHLLIINAVTALMLLLTLPGPEAMSIDKNSKCRDFLWDIPYTWILTYTLWNWVFFYGHWAGFGARIQIAVLGAALVIALFNNKRWAQARALTLGIFVIATFFWDANAMAADVSSWYDRDIYLFSALLACCCGGYLVVMRFKSRMAKPRPHSSAVRLLK